MLTAALRMALPAAFPILVLGVPTGTAWADDSWAGTGSLSCAMGRCDLGAVSSSAGGGAVQPRPAGAPASTGGDSGPHCVSVPVTDVITPEDGHSGQWYVLDCGGTLPEGSFGGTPLTGPPLWADMGTAQPSGPAVDPVALAAKAVSELQPPKPEIRLNPGAEGPQVVRVPTWLWLDEGHWQPVRATADVPGVSVVAVAKPYSVVWETGDGATVTCSGPGTPYSRRVDPASASPDCGHTYLRSSEAEPGGAFRVSVTVHWSVGWTGAGESGTYPDLTTTSTVAIRAVEVQSLVTGSR